MSLGTTDSLSYEFFHQLRSFPADLSAILVGLGLFDGAVALGPSASVLRALLGLFVLGFVPGYLLLVALVPTDREPIAPLAWGRETPAFVRDGFERAALSIGCSLLVLPVFALVVGTVGTGYEETTVVVGLNGLVSVGVVVAAYRRVQVPENRRYEVTIHRRFRTRLSDLYHEPTLGGAIHVSLVVAVVLATSTMALALVAPQDGDHTTSLSVLTETDNGTLVAGGYPETMATGENASFVLSVTNREGQQTTYTVVAELQRMTASDGGNAQAIGAASEIGRFEKTVDAGETWRRPHTVTPSITGENVRVTYLLYRGDAPANPDRESAYRSVYFWTTVTGGGA